MIKKILLTAALLGITSTAFATRTLVGDQWQSSDLTKTWMPPAVSGTLTVSPGGAFTAGSVIFEGATGLAQDNANFFWDSTNHRLGIGNAAPTSALSVGNSSQFTVSGVGALVAPSITDSAFGTAGVVHNNASGVFSSSLVDLTADVTGLLPNANLANPSTTVNGQTCTLGGVCTVHDASAVTAVSINSANGFAGSSSGGNTPSLTIQTTVTGITKGNGTALSAAVSGTDYQAPISNATAPAHQFFNQWTAPNTFGSAQPAFSDISGNITNAQLPTYTNHAVLLGTGAAGINSSAVGASNTVLHGNTGADPTYSAVSLTADVSGVLPAANGGSSPTTKNLYVDNGRTDSFTPDGSISRPFATISAAISQIITNADNGTSAYSVIIAPGNYNETLSFNNSLLFNISFVPLGLGSGAGNSGINVGTGGTAITSTSNNTQLQTLTFSGMTLNGIVNLSGDINNTNFCGTACTFYQDQFNNSATTFTLFDVNNVSFIESKIQGSGSVSTYTNVAFAYWEGAEGISGVTLHLVQNNGLNQPSQTFGNYLLLSNTKMDSTTTIDAGSEMDSITSIFESTAAVTNNGIISNFQNVWHGTLTTNAGSTNDLVGDVFSTMPTQNGGSVLTINGKYPYNPATPGNWSPVPTRFDTALDQLASRSAASGAPEQETPAGLVNNSNTSYSLSLSPVSAASVHVYLDGLILKQAAGAANYTISGSTITMGTAPNFGQTIYADYLH